MKKSYIAVLLVAVILGFSSTNSYAAHIDEHKGPALHIDTAMEVEPGYVKLQVKGFVCKLCSKKTKKALEELSFIESVDVDLNEQLVTIKLKRGQKFDENAVYDAIRAKGFSPYMMYMLDEDGRLIMKRL